MSSEKISDDDGDDLPEEHPDDEGCDEGEDDANGPKRLLILLPHCLFLPIFFSSVCKFTFVTPSRLVMGSFDLVVVIAVAGVDLSSEASVGKHFNKQAVYVFFKLVRLICGLVF